MNALDLLSRKALEPPPVVAVFGDDAFLRFQVITTLIRAALGTDAPETGLSRFQGSEADLADVLDELRMLPFLSLKRVVVIEEADPFVTAHRKSLEAYAERPSKTGTLILSVKSWPSNTKLAKAVEKTGLAVDCRSPKEREIPAWLSRYAESRLDVQLEPPAASLLLELIGPELGLLATEVEKLAAYVGEAGRIRKQDVAETVDAGRVLAVWEMIDRATTGDAAGALRILDQLLTSGEAHQRILGALAASLRKVYHAGRLRLNQRSLQHAAREAGVPSYPKAVEQLGRQHGHLGPSRVDRLPELLLHVDLELKGASTLEPRVVLERLLIELAQPRRD